MSSEFAGVDINVNALDETLTDGNSNSVHLLYYHQVEGCEVRCQPKSTVHIFFFSSVCVKKFTDALC